MIPPPHGGRLVERQLSGPSRDRRDAELGDLPKVRPFVDQLYDAEKIGFGAYSPLDGFMGPGELESVLDRGRLLNDLPWPIPILFPVPEGAAGAGASGLRPGDEVALLDGRDRAIALLRIEERFRVDRATLARKTYGTEDPAHPNVADLLRSGEFAWSGRVELLRHLDTVGNRPEPTPAELREEFRRLGWTTVAAYQCRNPPHTAHEYLQRVTLEREEVDGLLVHPVVGRLKKGDYRPEVILDAYDALVRAYYPASRVIVRPLGITMRYGGPKAALFLAIVRKNYGCGVYIVGRDQAGVGKYYDPYACHRIFDEYDIGVVPLRYEESFFCRKCGWMASEKVCPHGPGERVATSQTRVRESLAKGENLPTEILRPEVAEVLRRPDALLTS
ncbi:MAG TPA: sulfate adenylyltransferase [Thermoplasmata archaeon]|nr:sulfate adenylyltransferase [Thermoplasmata archaeon]